MERLILESIEIQKFRAFDHLIINHLGRVNLIVGKNNVGKSSLLEALQIYAHRASSTIIRQILGARDENRRSGAPINENIERTLSYAKYLFYGRKEIRVPSESIQIGPVNSPKETLTVKIDWFIRTVDNTGLTQFQKILTEEDGVSENSIPRFIIQFGGKREFHFPVDLRASSRGLRPEFGTITCISSEANGLNKKEIGALWDSIALTPQEKEVLNALRIIAPGVEDISIVGDPVYAEERIPIVKVLNIDEPLPIRNLGDGMQRMLGIALALVNAKDGILLIDEIENGLHYSVQADLWRLILQLSHRLNVQVFATSHSWDCIRAFQEAAQEHEQEGVLIRLENKAGNVSAVLFDEHNLGIATREQIEVR
jgi:predicted ATPase